MSKEQAHKRTLDEWIGLITEARQSGLSDSEWCRKNDINHHSFNSAIKRLRRKSFHIPKRADFRKTAPDAPSANERSPHQDIVRVGMIRDTSHFLQECHFDALRGGRAAEISLADGNITIMNNADPVAISAIVSAVRRCL